MMLGGIGLLDRAMARQLTKSSLQEADALIERSIASGEVRAAALYVRQGSFTFQRGYGKATSPESVFLLASITKPMTATGVMILVERGKLSLADPVRKYIPEFSGGGRDAITIRHLLTHTSGLPDQLSENIDLRKRHAPLEDFVAITCKTPLLFKPGSKVSYQSMGLLLAAEIVERTTRKPFRDFLREELFQPLGMTQTSLGLGGRKIPSTMQSQVEHAPAIYGTSDNDWNWNSLYWRDLGAPWGGAHSNVHDIAALLSMFLKPDGRVLKKETAEQMVTLQTKGMNEPWGLGWMLDPAKLGKACSPRTFGHWGSTGTIAWADRATGVMCVVLTTRPADHSRSGLLGPVSDAVSQAAT